MGGLSGKVRPVGAAILGDSDSTRDGIKGGGRNHFGSDVGYGRWRHPGQGVCFIRKTAQRKDGSARITIMVCGWTPRQRLKRGRNYVRRGKPASNAK